MATAYSDIIVERADSTGVTCRAHGEHATTLVDWQTMRDAAGQDDPELARRYTGALAAARSMVRGDCYWLEWTSEDGEPCRAIVGGDLPIVLGAPTGSSPLRGYQTRPQRTRQADPDEVAAVRRQYDLGREIDAGR